MATVNASIDGFALVLLELHDAVGHFEHEVLQHLRVDILPALPNHPLELVNGLDLDLIHFLREDSPQILSEDSPESGDVGLHVRLLRSIILNALPICQARMRSM